MMDEERRGGVSDAEGNQNPLNPHGDAAMPLENLIIAVFCWIEEHIARKVLAHTLGIFINRQLGRSDLQFEGLIA